MGGGWRGSRTWRAGAGGREWGAGVVFRAWCKDSGRGSVGVVCRVVKDQGGQVANGYRGWRGRRRLDGPLCPPTSHKRGAEPLVVRLARFALAAPAAAWAEPAPPFVTASIPAWCS